MRLDTAGTVINDALLELGLVPAALADPFTSTDPNVVGIRAHLKALGRELAAMRPWTHLQLEHSFATEASVDTYALPAGFLSLSPSTEWNYTNALPLGPVGAPDWQALKASGAVNTVNVVYRVLGGSLRVHPVPSGVQTLSYEYLSAYWVQPEGGDVPTSDTPTATNEVLWFDGPLLSRGLKVRFLEAKGFDSTAARNAYEMALAAAMGNDAAPTVLSIVPRSSRAPAPRLPETNWGV
jgi:hypothetical protein